MKSWTGRPGDPAETLRGEASPAPISPRLLATARDFQLAYSGRFRADFEGRPDLSPGLL